MKKIISILLIVVALSTILCSCGAKVERGITLENEYVNESLGIKFTLPSDWKFYTEDQIASLMNTTKDKLKDKNLLDSADVTTIFEFFAEKNSSGNNINMTIENLSASGNRSISMDDYIDAFKNMIKEQLVGATYTFSDTTTVKLGDNEYSKLEAKCTYNSISMTQYIYLRKVGNYMVAISATTTSKISSADFEAMFS